MARRPHNQQDFSGGEISADLLFRDNLDMYSKSVAEMINFVPNLQGQAVRTPGTRFVREMVGNPSYARVIPYITPTGKNTVVLMTPRVGATLGSLEILENVNDAVNSPAQFFTYEIINLNPEFGSGWSGWWPSPINYISSKNSAQLGWSRVPESLELRLRRGHDIPSGDPMTAFITQSFLIPQNTDHIIVQPRFAYVRNGGNGKGVNYTVNVVISVGSTPFTNDIGVISQINIKPGSPAYAETSRFNHAFLAGTQYFTTVVISANTGTGGDGKAVTLPVVNVDYIRVLSTVSGSIESDDLGTVVPYTASQLRDVHFVQSPYTAVVTPPDVNYGVGKELVFTHGGVQPMRLYLDGISYAFEPIFTANATQFHEQWNWPTNGYPAACTSFSGRLVLAGSLDGSAASPAGSNSETVWLTEPGDWGKFTDPTSSPVAPSDSVSFASTYRSPIRWIVGENVLMIGAESMEYTASAQTIFQPSDHGVQRQSTHGSNRVQPVVMGKYAMFPAEGGSKLRAAKFEPDAPDTWTAPDLTLFNPRILESRVVRVVRMRNPNQMAVVVLGNGQLAILTFDETMEVAAWSRMDVGGTVIDAAVVVNKGNALEIGGDDILYLLVKRVIGGIEKTYLEAVNLWYGTGDKTYMNSYVSAITFPPTNVISDLSHLEGNFVQVVTNNGYQGTFLVEGGQVILTDQFGDPINHVVSYAGVPAPCRLRTLPMASFDPSTIKSLTNLTVQTLGSSRPLINGERPPDRDPITPLGITQPMDEIGRNTVVDLGSDPYKVITVGETLPVALTVARIFATVTENSV